MTYVYFLGNGAQEDAAVKIGVAKDVRKRIHQLQTGAPFKLTCFDYIECSDEYAKEIERALHLHFVRRRVIREWFNIRREEIVPAVTAVFKSLDIEIDRHWDTFGEAPKARMNDVLKRGG